MNAANPKANKPKAKRTRKAPIEVTITDADKPLIDRLPDHFQKVLRASGSYRARAAALRVPVGTIRSRLNRARIALLALREKTKAGA